MPASQETVAQGSSEQNTGARPVRSTWRRSLWHRLLWHRSQWHRSQWHCSLWRRGLSIALLLSLTALLSTASSLAAEEGTKDTVGIKGLLGDQKGKKDAPLYVKSDSLRLDAKSRVFIYDGNVEIVRDDVRITCDSMRGTYGEDSQLKTILCKDNVVITRAQEMRATANRANYDVEDAMIELTEGPSLARDGNLLSADKITIFVDEDRSEAEGNVRVKVIKAEADGPGAR